MASKELADNLGISESTLTSQFARTQLRFQKKGILISRKKVWYKDYVDNRFICLGKETIFNAF